MAIFIKKVKEKISRWAIFCLFFCFLLGIAIFNQQAVFAAFVEPTAQPPEKNMPEYIMIGSDDQARSGKLRLGSSDNSNIQYQLEVLGEGADINDVVVEEGLTVDAQGSSATLYVDSVKNQVAIGTLNPLSDLTVDGNVTINAFGLGSGLSAWSDSEDEHTIYGTTTNSSYAGLAGVGTTADNYGVYGYNYSGIAVKGENTSNDISGVYGQATDGIGIYGSNINSDSQWAGYFSGRLESNKDVSGAKFVPTQLQQSLVPYTSGQTVADYEYINKALHYFDGTYVWATKHNRITKIRAADGFRIFEREIDNTEWLACAGCNKDEITDLIFDGNNIWVTVFASTGTNLVRLAKLDPYTGVSVCDNRSGSAYDFEQPRSLAFDGQYYWILDRSVLDLPVTDGGTLFKINNLCQRVQDDGGSDITIILADGSAGHEVDFYWGKVIYNGSFFMVTGREYNTDQVVVFNVNPSSLKAVGWTDFTASEHYNPIDIIFDNYYYWVSNNGTASNADNSITKFFLSPDKICTAPNFDPDNPVSCTVDTDCDSAPGSGDGACFAQPVEFGTYIFTSITEPRQLAFDGTYVWVNNDQWNEYGVARLLASDPSQQAHFMENDRTYGVLFDGSSIWASTNGSVIKKLYSGSGYGLNDLSQTLTLWQNAPLFGAGFGSHAEGDPRPGYPQEGSINISESGQIGEGATAGGELEVGNNVWGGSSDTTINVSSGGTSNCSGTADCFNCPEGQFIKNIITDSQGVVTQIECRPL